MLPHPVAFGVACPVSDDGSTVGDFTPFLNQQLTGADHDAKIASFLGQVERWRLAYMGVSIHFDGPALSNQGSIVVDQTSYAPREYHASVPTGHPAAPYAAITRIRANDAMNVDLVKSAEFPNYDRAASMPNSYVGEIKDGAYIPLKLTKTCQQWQSRETNEVWVANPPGILTDLAVDLPTAEDPQRCSFPFAGLTGLGVWSGSPLMRGTVTSSLCNDIVAHVCGRNISPASSLVFTFRVGFEVQVEPGTLLSPYQRVSPQYDPVAMKAYFMVARTLKDAYPVSYNDLGKLWNVISGGLEFAAPVLSVIHPGLGTVARAIKSGGDAIAGIARRKSDGRGAVTSAVDIQQVQRRTEDALKKQFDQLSARTLARPSLKRKVVRPTRRRAG
jgi:hypothetical protein